MHALFLSVQLLEVAGTKHQTSRDVAGLSDTLLYS